MHHKQNSNDALDSLFDDPDIINNKQISLEDIRFFNI
jgi:hypothetical protein